MEAGRDYSDYENEGSNYSDGSKTTIVAIRIRILWMMRMTATGKTTIPEKQVRISLIMRMREYSDHSSKTTEVKS